MEKTALKVTVTVVLILTGGLLGILATPPVTAHYSQGILIDFGDYDIDYMGVDDGNTNAVDSLVKLADYYSIKINWEGSRMVTAIKDGNTYPGAGDSRTWSLYVTEKGALDWKVYPDDPAKIHLGDYSAVCWGLCAENDKPTPGVDATGYCYYGNAQSSRVVSMAPSCTETICASGAGSIIVGVDEFSNYPTYIQDDVESGKIVSIGGYTNPSYEAIAKLNPDMVIGVCDQSVHLTVIEKMRAHGVNCLAIYTGDSIESILNNTYMVGAAMNYQLKSVQTIQEIEAALDTLDGILDAGSLHTSEVMISLSTSKSPWIAGGNTYASDVIDFTNCNNIYSTETGWVMVNSETVAARNPDYIIVVSSDISATKEEYDNMMSSLSAEWRNTNAFENGDIYLLAGGATDLASRPSTRIAQFTELMCRILQPNVFIDIDVPYYIGDNYRDYLYYTKELGFDK